MLLLLITVIIIICPVRQLTPRPAHNILSIEAKVPVYPSDQERTNESTDESGIHLFVLCRSLGNTGLASIQRQQMEY